MLIKYDCNKETKTQVDKEPTLQNMYDEIGCDIVEYVQLTDTLAIVCDECGLMKGGSILNQLFIPGREMMHIAGNLLFVGTDLMTGETTGLSEKDMRHVMDDILILSVGYL